MEEPLENWKFSNVIKVDGFRGSNGSFVPHTSNILTGISSCTQAKASPPNKYAVTNRLSVSPYIALPNSFSYLSDSNLTGPVDPVTFILDPGGNATAFGYDCSLNRNGTAITTGETPYVSLTVAINGVDYMIDSKDNIIQPASRFRAEGVCPVSIVNYTAIHGVARGQVPLESFLGMPFLRSVYL